MNGCCKPLKGDVPSVRLPFVAMTIIVAQAVMILTSMIAMRVAASRGYWRVIPISFMSLPIRGAIAAYSIAPWGVYPVQLLDGIGAGLQGVAVPGLVARVMNGTGRVDAGHGRVRSAHGCCFAALLRVEISISLPQQRLLHLAHGIARQIIDE
jgi:hypothetical protein